MMRSILALVVTLALPAAAWSAPLAVRHGRTIRVALAGRSEAAVALRAVAGGWRLDLAGVGSGGTLLLRDATDGATGPRTFELALSSASILLDDTRFRADHAYRVELRRGTAIVSSALIYLQPPRRSRMPVVFGDRDAEGAPAADGDVPSMDKGSL
jgi:hypothetical protein